MGDLRQGNTLIRVVFVIASIALLLEVLATALPLWSKKDDMKYGLWTICLRVDKPDIAPYPVELCTSVWTHGECQGLYDSTKAFSILSIGFTAACSVISMVIIRQRKMQGYKLTCIAWSLCILSMFSFMFSLLCWVFWLSFAESICNNQPKIHSYNASFVLQVSSFGPGKRWGVISSAPRCLCDLGAPHL